MLDVLGRSIQTVVFTVGNPLPLPALTDGPKGPRVEYVACSLCSCVCPARPAAGAGVCPPIGYSTQWSRTSAECTSALSPSPWSGSQRTPEPEEISVKKERTIAVCRRVHANDLKGLTLINVNSDKR